MWNSELHWCFTSIGSNAVTLHYFSCAQDAADVPNLFNTWWVISNSEARFKASTGLKMLQFWVTASWHYFKWLLNGCRSGRIRSYLIVRNSLYQVRQAALIQTAKCQAALIQTAKCQAALIEDLLSEGYSYVLTASLQSDPLERRYGQYRQMSG